MFGGGIVVTILVLIACGLGMASIVSAYVEGARRSYLNGLEQTLNEIQVSETSFRNGVANAQLIWQEASDAPASIVDEFFLNDQRVATRPHPSLVIGVPAQTGDRAEVARYLSLSVLLARICAASSINRGRTLEGYHYSTRTGLFALIPHRSRDDPALVSPESRARVLDALRVDFERPYPGIVDTRPHVRWLPPFTDPVSGQSRIRLAAEARDNGKPFAVLVTEYPTDYLLSWLADYRPEGMFYITTADGELVTMDPTAGDTGRAESLLKLNPWRGGASLSGAPVFRDGFLLFHGKLESTGWTLAYALSWTDIAAGVARSAGTLGAATLLALMVMWGLLLRFHRREFVPLYAHSQRVFDSEALCRSVIEMAPIGLGLITRDDGRFMLVSPALTDMIGRIGGDYHALSSQVVDAWQARGDAGGVQHDGLLLGDMQAAPLHLEFIACGARYQGTDVLIVAVADVTAKRQLVQQLEEAVRAADSANAAKSSFLTAMSHEIRTPLNVILGNLELLERSALDAVQHDRVHTLRASATSLLALVGDILDFSKIEAGAMSVESIEFDVIETVERELNAFATIAKAKGLQLFCEIHACSTQRMRGDPTRLAQVLRNLVNNALKFTDAGRVTVRVAVVAGGARRARIVDRGRGYRHRHRRRTSVQVVQGIFAGRHVDHAALRRHRPRARAVQPARRRDGRPHLGGERGGRRQPFQGASAARHGRRRARPAARGPRTRAGADRRASRMVRFCIAASTCVGIRRQRVRQPVESAGRDCPTRRGRAVRRFRHVAANGSAHPERLCAADTRDTRRSARTVSRGRHRTRVELLAPWLARRVGARRPDGRPKQDRCRIGRRPAS